MAGKIYERKALRGLIPVFQGLFDDLKTAGFSQIFPASNANVIVTSGKAKFVMESTSSMNPLHTTQPYRILVDLDANAIGAVGRIRVSIANPQQIDSTGAYSRFPGNWSSNLTHTDVMGQLGTAWMAGTGPGVQNIPFGSSFMTRNASNTDIDLGSVYSYQLVVSDHGVTVVVWEEGDETNPRFSWFCVQSPVDKDTGAPLLTDNSPIFCVYSADGVAAQKFVVNEADVFRPTRSVSAIVDSLNSSAIINGTHQVAIAKGNKYLVTFPNRLNTERYAYTEELDMIGYTSASVIADGSEIPVTVYGESEPRVYRAMKSNGPNNTMMRLLTLVQGGGVPDED